MIRKNKKDIVKATKEGKLYITTEDFFNQEKIKETIFKLLESDLIKDIDERNRLSN